MKKFLFRPQRANGRNLAYAHVPQLAITRLPASPRADRLSPRRIRALSHAPASPKSRDKALFTRGQLITRGRGETKEEFRAEFEYGESARPVSADST